MLASSRLRCLDRPVAVSLEQLVPADHFYRHLDAALDLSVVRVWVADRYASSGRPSIDPVIFFKLQLIMFFEGIRSERQLVKTASLNLAHRWYLGYHLDEPLPDHSSLTRIRQRLGLAVFRRFFEYVVDRCDVAGLIGARRCSPMRPRCPATPTWIPWCRDSRRWWTSTWSSSSGSRMSLLRREDGMCLSTASFRRIVRSRPATSASPTARSA